MAMKCRTTKPGLEPDVALLPVFFEASFGLSAAAKVIDQAYIVIRLYIHAAIMSSCEGMCAHAVPFTCHCKCTCACTTA